MERKQRGNKEIGLVTREKGWAKSSQQKNVRVTISDNMFKIENVVRFMVGTALWLPTTRIIYIDILKHFHILRRFRFGVISHNEFGQM